MENNKKIENTELYNQLLEIENNINSKLNNVSKSEQESRNKLSELMESRKSIMEEIKKAKINNDIDLYTVKLSELEKINIPIKFNEERISLFSQEKLITFDEYKENKNNLKDIYLKMKEQIREVITEFSNEVFSNLNSLESLVKKTNDLLIKNQRQLYKMTSQEVNENGLPGAIDDSVNYKDDLHKIENIVMNIKKLVSEIK